MQAIEKIKVNYDHIEKNHLKLILSGLETGLIAMKEYKEVAIRLDDEDVLYRNLKIDMPDGDRIIFNEIQKIHVSEINYENTPVFEDGYLKLDRVIAGYLIKEDSILDEIKKGNFVGYSKEVESYYVLYCKEF